MGVNKAEQSLEDKIIRDIDGLKRDLREIKTKQPIGADILQVVPLPLAGVGFAGPFTIPANGATNVNVNFTPDDDTLTVWNFLWTLYIDVDDPDNAWPSGASLTAGQLNIHVFSWVDWFSSSDSTNERTYKIRILNDDTSSHDYYLRIRAYLPSIGASVS